MKPSGRAAERRWYLGLAAVSLVGLSLWFGLGDTGIESPADDGDMTATQSRERAGDAEASSAVSPQPSYAAAVDGGQARSPSLPRVPQEVIEQTRERLTQTLADIAAEPVDAAWAEPTAGRLQDDLRDATEGYPSELRGVECRSASCVATLEFPDYATAFRTYRRLLIQPYSVNCQRSMSVPPPEDPAVSYEGKLIFSCDRNQERHG